MVPKGPGGLALEIDALSYNPSHCPVPSQLFKGEGKMDRIESETLLISLVSFQRNKT